MNTIAAWKGTVMNHDRPILETELPLDGSRFEGIISPVVRQPIFAIRLRPRRIFTLDEYEQRGILTHKGDPLNRQRGKDQFHEAIQGLTHAEIIRAAVRAKKNILVVGSTGSGKTTLVNAILDAQVQIAPNDRVISIEDTTELQCAVKNYVDLRAVGNGHHDGLPSRVHAAEAHANRRRRGARRRSPHDAEGVEHGASGRRRNRPRQ